MKEPKTEVDMIIESDYLYCPYKATRVSNQDVQVGDVFNDVYKSTIAPLGGTAIDYKGDTR